MSYNTKSFQHMLFMKQPPMKHDISIIIKHYANSLTLASMDVIVPSLCVMWLEFQIVGVQTDRLRKTVHSRLHS